MVTQEKNRWKSCCYCLCVQQEMQNRRALDSDNKLKPEIRAALVCITAGAVSPD